MRLLLSPQRRDDALTISKSGDVLKINGEAYDFTPLPDGGELPRNAIDCEWICGSVKRVDGELIVPVILPHRTDASEAARFPEPLVMSGDGEVILPS